MIFEACPLCLNKNTHIFFERVEKVYGFRQYWRCRGCDFVFLSPGMRLPPEAEKARYDLHRNTRLDEGYLNFIQQLVSPMSEYIEKESEGLDYGCGEGRPIQKLMEEEGQARVSNFDYFYFPDSELLHQKYDFLTCSETAEHFFYPYHEFQLFQSILKRNGILGIMTEVLEPDIQFKDWWYINDPTHVGFYSPKTFDWIAEQFGFEILSRDRKVYILRKK